MVVTILVLRETASACGMSVSVRVIFKEYWGILPEKRPEKLAKGGFYGKFKVKSGEFFGKKFSTPSICTARGLQYRRKSSFLFNGRS